VKTKKKGSARGPTLGKPLFGATFTITRILRSRLRFLSALYFVFWALIGSSPTADALEIGVELTPSLHFEVTSENFSALKKEVLLFKALSKVPKPQASRGGRAGEASLQDWFSYFLKDQSAEGNALLDWVQIEYENPKMIAYFPRSLPLKYLDMTLSPAKGKSTQVDLSIPDQVRKSAAQVERIFLPVVPSGARLKSLKLGAAKVWFSGQALGTKKEPILARGEKLFRNACVSCHIEKTPYKSPVSHAPISILPQSSHQDLAGILKYDPKEARALDEYMKSLLAVP